MKKLLRALLSIALVFAMACPLTALADDTSKPGDPVDKTPIWVEWGFESPKEFLEITMGWYGGGPCSYTSVWEAFYFPSKDEFMRYYDLNEDEYNQLEEAWQAMRAEQGLLRIKELEELGGTPGIVNVMYDGSFIKFPDAVPELIDGVSFIPAKPFFEAMGAELRYDVQTKAITAVFKDRSLRFIPGQDTMTVTENGAAREQTLKNAPYNKNNASYVPAAGVVEALGLDIYWDSMYKTIVIIDSAALIAGIDKNFTVMNQLFDMPIDLMSGEGTYKTVVDLLVSWTQFNSLDGDSTGKIDANITIISDGRNFSADGVMNLSELLGLMLDGGYNDYGGEGPALPPGVADALGAAKVEIIFNYDEDMLYIRSPLLSAYSPELPNDAWISISGINEELGYAGLENLTGGLSLASIAGAKSVGALICAETTAYLYSRQIKLYDSLITSATEAKALFGDGRFVKNGGDYSLTITKDDLGAAYGDTDYGFGIKAFDLNVKIKTSGGAVTGASGGLKMRQGYYGYSGYYNNDIQYTYEFDISPARVYVSIEEHEKNTQKALYVIDISSSETALKVPSAPPPGDKIVAVEELFPGEFSGVEPNYVMPLAA